MVDLNKAIAKHKGAVAYAYTEFDCDNPRPVQLRFACIVAIKVWVNGQLVASHPVYHAGAPLDQYMVSTTLNRGSNAILLKVCQNEQTEDWAQRWLFQVRVCDVHGTAVLSQDRLAEKGTQ